METSTISAKLILLLSGLSGWTAYGAILGVLFVCGLGLPIPEDITLIAAGILSALGHISLMGALLAGFFGVMVGDTLLFFLGRKFGRRILRLPVFRRIFTRERLLRAEKIILKNSRSICFVARFLPGLRAPIFLTSGMMGVRPIVFLTLDGLAALLSVPFWVLVGHWFGENIDEVLSFAKKAQTSIVLAIGTLILLYIAYRWWRKRL